MSAEGLNLPPPPPPHSHSLVMPYSIQGDLGDVGEQCIQEEEEQEEDPHDAGPSGCCHLRSISGHVSAFPFQKPHDKRSVSIRLETGL